MLWNNNPPLMPNINKIKVISAAVHLCQTLASALFYKTSLMLMKLSSCSLRLRNVSRLVVMAEERRDGQEDEIRDMTRVPGEVTGWEP